MRPCVLTVTHDEALTLLLALRDMGRRSVQWSTDPALEADAQAWYAERAAECVRIERKLDELMPSLSAS